MKNKVELAISSVCDQKIFCPKLNFTGIKLADKTCQKQSKWDAAMIPRNAMQNVYHKNAILWVLILYNDQHQNTISTNNRNNSEINQQHTPFVDSS